VSLRSTIARTAVAVTLLAVAACGGSDDADDTGSAEPSTKRYYDQYVALGDSYTAGPLIGPIGPDDLCIRSGINYPALIARALGSSKIDRSCNSADLSHLVEPQEVEGGITMPPQLEAVTPRTDLVTLGMGANPAATMAWFATCPSLREEDPEGSPCREHYRTESGGDEVIRILRKERTQLVSALDLIKERAPGARVLVIGYPAIFPSRGDCPEQYPVATGDLRYARGILTYLNKILRQAAEQTGTEYVDVHAATKGHDICSDDPWVQGRKDELGVALAFHPHAEEQRAVATLVQRLVR
jgi:lysophospholipase L1-like esterase